MKTMQTTDTVKMVHLNKQRLCELIVERRAFFGSRTTKKLSRWFNKNFDSILGLNKGKAKYALRKSIAELNKYKAEEVKKLMRLPKSDLLTMIRHMSSKELDRRYAKNHLEEKFLPKVVLKQERDLVISKEDLVRWKRQSAMRRRKEAKEGRTAQVVPAKVVKPRRKKLTTMAWVKNICNFNATMHTAEVVAGLEG